MTLNRRFLHSSPKFLLASKRNIVLMAIVCVVFGLIFYAFLYMSREALRIISVDEYNNIFTMSDREVLINNFLLALISNVFAQSLFLYLILAKSKIKLKKKSYLIGSAINDQRVVSLSFVNWFARVSTCSALILFISNGGKSFTFTSIVSAIILITAIVLFLQSWVTINRIYKKQSVKWMGISAVVILLGSITVAFINIVDYNRINNLVLQKNIEYNFHTEWPMSSSSLCVKGYFCDNELYLINNKEYPQNADHVLVYYHNRNYQVVSDLDSLPVFLADNFENSIILNINSNIKMEFVNRVKSQLLKAGITNFAYRVNHVGVNISPYERKYLRFALPRYIGDSTQTRLLHQSAKSQFTNLIELMPAEGNDTVLLNHSPVGLNQLHGKLYGLIMRDSSCCLVLTTRKDTPFFVYLAMTTKYQQAINQARDTYIIEHLVNISDDYDAQAKARSAYPLLIVELSK